MELTVLKELTSDVNGELGDLIIAKQSANDKDISLEQMTVLVTATDYILLDGSAGEFLKLHHNTDLKNLRMMQNLLVYLLLAKIARPV